MLNIAIDPYLLHLENPCNSSDAIIQYAEGIIEWSSIISRRDVKLLISKKMHCALHAEGVFPEDHHLKNSLLHHSVEEFDFKTIKDLTHIVVDRSISLEEITGIEEIVLSNDFSKITPSEYIHRIKGQCQQAYRDVLICIGAMNSFTDTETPIYILTRGENQSKNNAISVQATIEITDPDDVFDQHQMNLPYELNDEILAFSTTGELIDKVATLSQLDDPISFEKFQSVLEIKVEEMSRIMKSDKIPKLAYKIGAKFIDSLNNNNFNKRSDWASVCMESCARIILNCPKNDLNEFRISDTPQSEQKVRLLDNATAWRTHLTKSNEGFRLMFWKLSDGTIEFANVNPKKIVEIY